MGKEKDKGQKLQWLLFGVYLIFLVYLMFFSEGMGRTQGPRFSYNLVPFREIKRCLFHWKAMGLFNAVMNLAGNVAAFFPFGYFLPRLLKSARGFFVMLFTTMLFSLCLEVLQLFTQVGSFDVDDILLNTAGGLLGYCCYRIFQKWKFRKERKEQGGGR